MRAIIAAAVLILISSAAIAQTPTPTAAPNSAASKYSFTIVDIPGALPNTTRISAVNDRGDIAGTALLPGFVFADGVQFYLNSVYIARSGVVTASANEGICCSGGLTVTGLNNQDVAIGFDVIHTPGIGNPFEILNGNPDRPITFLGFGGFPAAINDSGEIVGVTDGVFTFHGFVYQNGVEKLFDAPGAASTLLTAINNNGDIAGNFSTTPFFPSSIVSQGFLQTVKGQFTTINYPGSNNTVVVALNEKGEVAGNYTVSGVRAGFPPGFPNLPITGEGAFFYRNGKYTNIQIPGATGISAVALNKQSMVVGNFIDTIGQHGFVFGNGNVTPLDVPDAISTTVTGINNNGEIVGYFNDTDGHMHGFAAVSGPQSVSHAKLTLTGK